MRNLYCSQTPQWREEKSNQLEGLAEDLVGKHWEAIKAVAKALLATDWLTQNQTSGGAQWSPAEEKRLTDAQIRNVLQPFGICALPQFAD